MIKTDAVVGMAQGLHARPAAALALAAGKFKSQISIEHGAKKADAKSIMGVLMLAAAAGAVLSICADGEDEEQAVAVLAAMLESQSKPV